MLLYDFIVLRNGFAAAFGSLRDKLLLAVISAIFVAWINSSAPTDSGRPDWPIVAAAALLLGARVQTGLARRLDDFVADSLLAADALEASERRRYLAAWHLMAAMAAMFAAALVGRPWIALVVPCYAGGALLAVFWRAVPRPPFMSRARSTPGNAASAPSRRSRSPWAAMTLSVARRQIGLASEPPRLLASLAAAALVTTLTAVMLQSAAKPPVAEAVFGFAAIGLAAALSRVDHGIVGFTAFAGHGPSASVAAHAAASAIAGVCLIGSAWLAGPRFALLASLIFAGGLTLLTLRVLAYRSYPKRQADLMLTLILGAGGLIGSGAPFLLPPLVVGAMLLLWRRARSVTWLAP